MRKLLAFSLLLLTPASARSSNFSASARGTSAAEFLELGVGARAVAMGEAYGAVADEASALYWNPAALTRVPSRSATFMHAAYVASSYFDYAAYAQNLGSRYGAVGAGFQYFSAGGITQTDATGTDVGTFTPYDLAATVGYAHKIDGTGLSFMDGGSLGLGVKFIQSKILNSARTAAADLGVLSPGYLNDRLHLALTALNMGGTLRFEQAKEKLPFVLRLGSAYKITDQWLAAMDLAFPRNDNGHVALGTEYQIPAGESWKFVGRTGFNSQTVGSIDGFTGISFGLGIGSDRILMDYAFVPLGGVGEAHRLSLTLNF